MKSGGLSFILAVGIMVGISVNLCEAHAETVLKTGITACTNGRRITRCPSPDSAFFGQDACYQAGADRSYTKLGENGTVLLDTATLADGWCMTRDNNTGLVWEVKTNANKRDKYTWAEAQAHCAALVLGGYDDWRLPTVKELASLVDFGITDPGPVLNTRFFPKTENTWYWTSSLFAGCPLYACFVSFNKGNVGYFSCVSDRNNVRAVRTGQ